MSELSTRALAKLAAYAYLSGSPIAGESHFEVTPVGPSRCRLEAVFAYQEIGALAVLVLHLFAARLHDDVVLEQVQRAAAHAGGRLLSATTDFLPREARVVPAPLDVEQLS